MFKNLFRNQNVDDIIDNIKARGAYTVAYPDAPKEEVKHALFTVGMNEDGQTQLTVGYPTSITLTINDETVAYLIKQLAVNIDHAYTVTVKENEIA